MGNVGEVEEITPEDISRKH